MKIDGTDLQEINARSMYNPLNSKMAEVSKSSGVGEPSSNMFYLTLVEGVEGNGGFALRFPEAEKLQFLLLSPQKGMSPPNTVLSCQICH